MIGVIVLDSVVSQGAYYPNHWYGANSGNIRSGIVPEWGPVPVSNAGTLAPHVCGFNPFTRKCMDPENYCPGRCMNFRYTYNTLYDCEIETMLFVCCDKGERTSYLQSLRSTE
ncbi:hypothetical protein Q1695_012183 [Nippostrongylus brasiliensis]|nr:hypothetical protein Q1695_012183 [Nippostrongylus brasiliensis]